MVYYIGAVLLLSFWYGLLLLGSIRFLVFFLWRHGENSSICSVFFCEVPRLAAPEKRIKGCSSVDLSFDSAVYIFIVKEMPRSAHDGLGFSNSTIDLRVFVEKGGDNTFKIFKLLYEVYSGVMREN